MDVPVLDPEVAAGFLVSRTNDPDRAAALELAAELGGLPLALEQAAAYMQATGTTLARYLPLFRDRQADLLARGPALRRTESGSVGRNRITKASPGTATSAPSGFSTTTRHRVGAKDVVSGGLAL
jgi:hypothetical protein